MRTFLKIFLRFAPVLAALSLMTAPASAQSIDIRIGGGIYYGGNSYQYGNTDWAEARFIYNRRSQIRTTILPYLAETAEQTGVWLPDVGVNVPGVRSAEVNNETHWLTRVNGYDLNVSVRLDNRWATYSNERALFTVWIWANGGYLPNAGRTYTIQVLATKLPNGYWRFEPNY